MYAILVMFLWVGVTSANQVVLPVKEDHNRFLFESSPTPLQKMFDVSMQMVDDLAQLRDNILFTHERSIMQDLLAGRVVRLYSATQALIKDYYSGIPIYAQDLEYLVMVLEQNALTYGRVMPMVDYSPATQMLYSVIRDIDQLLSL